jgi:hypothetical protein
MTENQALHFVQDDKAVVILRAVSPPEGSGVGVGCHSEAVFMAEESGVKAFQKQNQILTSFRTTIKTGLSLALRTTEKPCHSEAGFMAEESDC